MKKLLPLMLLSVASAQAAPVAYQVSGTYVGESFVQIIPFDIIPVAEEERFFDASTRFEAAFFYDNSVVPTGSGAFYTGVGSVSQFTVSIDGHEVALVTEGLQAASTSLSGGSVGGCRDGDTDAALDCLFLEGAVAPGDPSLTVESFGTSYMLDSVSLSFSAPLGSQGLTLAALPEVLGAESGGSWRMSIGFTDGEPFPDTAVRAVSTTANLSVIPIPAAIWLFLSALFGLVLTRRSAR